MHGQSDSGGSFPHPVFSIKIIFCLSLSFVLVVWKQNLSSVSLTCRMMRRILKLSSASSSLLWLVGVLVVSTSSTKWSNLVVDAATVSAVPSSTTTTVDLSLVGQPAAFGVPWWDRSDSDTDAEDEEDSRSTASAIARVLYLSSNPLLCENIEETKVQEAATIELVSKLSSLAAAAAAATDEAVSSSPSNSTTVSVDDIGSIILPIAILVERGTCAYSEKAKAVETIFGLSISATSDNDGGNGNNLVKYLLIQNYESDGDGGDDDEDDGLPLTLTFGGDVDDTQILSVAGISYKDGEGKIT